MRNACEGFRLGSSLFDPCSPLLTPLFPILSSSSTISTYASLRIVVWVLSEFLEPSVMPLMWGAEMGHPESWGGGGGGDVHPGACFILRRLDEVAWLRLKVGKCCQIAVLRAGIWLHGRIRIKLQPKRS